MIIINIIIIHYYYYSVSEMSERNDLKQSAVGTTVWGLLQDTEPWCSRGGEGQRSSWGLGDVGVGGGGRWHEPQEVSLTVRSSSITLLSFVLCSRDLCRSSSRFFDVCVSLILLLKGGCVSTLSGSALIFCCSERRHAAMTTAGVSSHWSGYSPPRPRRWGCSSSKVDNRFLDLTVAV